MLSWNFGIGLGIRMKGGSQSAHLEHSLPQKLTRVHNCELR